MNKKWIYFFEFIKNMLFTLYMEAGEGRDHLTFKFFIFIFSSK